MVFPPRPLADDVYVDGGVLQNMPVQAAAQLGATRIIAVLAVPLRHRPRRARLPEDNMVDVFLRAVGDVAFGGPPERRTWPYPPPAGTT